MLQAGWRLPAPATVREPAFSSFLAILIFSAVFLALVEADLPNCATEIASERAKTPLRSVALPEGTKFDGPRVQKAAAPAPAAPAPQVVSARPGANPVARATSPIEARSKSPPPSSSSSEGDAVPRKRIQSFAALVVETTSTVCLAYNGVLLFRATPALSMRSTQSIC